MPRNPPVIVLWGLHRNPKREPGNAPANVDKGVRELIALGQEVHSIYPSNMRHPLVARVFGWRGAYRTATPAMVRAARRSGGPIYTSCIPWARIVARLKKRGTLRNRLIVRWAGIDSDLEAIASGLPSGEKDAEILRQADVCLLASMLFREAAAQAMPEAAPRLQFWPTGIDTSFYEVLRERHCGQGSKWDVVAVGSDNKRDWSLPLQLAALGVRVALVTEDEAARQQFEARGAAARDTATLFFKAGFAESARVMVDSRCILIATLPNIRFSGSTTVGVAAALAKPLLLDDAAELEGYGLRAGYNCELFQRGNVGSALQAVRSVLGEPAHAKSLGERIAVLAEQLDLKAYAVALNKCLRSDWIREDFQGTSQSSSPG